MKFGGYKPSPPDDRDLPFEASLVARLGATDEIETVVLPRTTSISTQDSQDCVANAGCDAVELLAGTPVQLSRRAAYYWARWLDGDQCKDEGTYIRNFFKVSTRIGICRENVWAYGSPLNGEPSLLARQNAYDHRTAAYYRIDSDTKCEDVEIAIRGGFPVVFGVQVEPEFVSYHGGEDVVFEAPISSVGGHAMVVVGFEHAPEGRRFLIRNSWGIGWGLRSRPGHCWVADSFIRSSSELWVPTVIA